MKQISAWATLEWKKILHDIPGICIKLAIFVLLVSMAFFCGARILEQKEKPDFVLGYVAKEDELTRQAISYISGLDSIEEWCRFEKVTSKEEGMFLLEEGKLDALFVIPDQMIQSILTGQNLQPPIYMTNTNSISNILFKDLEEAGIHMLQVAQSQIYVAYGLGLKEFCDEINRNNLQLVAGRRELFQHKTVFAGKGLTTASYYRGAMATCFVMILPIFFVGAMVKRREHRLYYHRKTQVSFFYQALLQTLVLSVYLCFCYSILFGVFGKMDFLCVILLSLSIASYMGVIFSLFEQSSHCVITGILLLGMQCFVGGCILPDVLLSGNMQKFARFLPVCTWKDLVYSLICKTRLAEFTRIHICLWMIVCLLLQWLILSLTCKAKLFVDTTFHKESKKRALPKHRPLWFVMLKKYFHNGKFLCSLLLPAILFLCILFLEQQGDETSKVGIYTQNAELAEAYLNQEGNVQYVLFENEDKLEKAVFSGQILCGYRIPGDIEERIKQQDAIWSIAVMEREDAILTNAVDERVFAVLFEIVSKDYFMNLLETKHMILPENDRLKDAFHVSVELVGASGNAQTDSGNHTSVFLLKVMLKGLMIIICFIYGCYQMRRDSNRNCYQRNRVVIYGYEAVFSTVLAIALLCFS